MIEKTKNWESVKTVSNALEISKNVVRGMCERAEIAGVSRYGRLWRIPRTWLESELQKLEVSR